MSLWSQNTCPVSSYHQSVSQGQDSAPTPQSASQGKDSAPSTVLATQPQKSKEPFYNEVLKQNQTVMLKIESSMN